MSPLHETHFYQHSGYMMYGPFSYSPRKPNFWYGLNFSALLSASTSPQGLMGDKASFVKFSYKCGLHNHLSRGARYTHTLLFIWDLLSPSLLYPYFLLRQLRVSSSGGVIGPRHRGPSPSWCHCSLLQKFGGKVTYFIPPNSICSSYQIIEPLNRAREK